MRLPPEYVEELLNRISPLCRPQGTVAYAELEVLICKAARVAHVAPAAKPFVAGLLGALSAATRSANEAILSRHTDIGSMTTGQTG